MEEAQLCQHAENSFVGVPSGLLDQFSSLFGKKDHALFLDCATLRYQQVPLGRDDVRVVLVDTGEKHALIDGKYADLRQSCERACSRLSDLMDQPARFLRDVRLPDFERYSDELDPEDRPRAEHVIRENERVLRGLAAIKSKHYEELKRLMLASHASSRDLFGNSTPALDFLVEEASKLPGFLGAKLTGGGFGGSTVSLVEKASEEAFTKELAARFEAKFSRVPPRLSAGIGEGAGVEEVPIVS
jgi:galactokinase